MPWRSAGNRTETGGSADEIVRSTGWVFNNETGSELTLEEFVATGNKEVRRYMRQFGFDAERLAPLTLLEIGSGIGRMTASFTEQETKDVTYLLSQAGTIFQKLNSMALNRISASENLLVQIKTFNNTKVREGQAIKDTYKHTQELIKWVEAKLNKEILDAKKADTKLKRQAEKNEIMRFYRNNASELKNIFDLMNMLVDSKNMIVKKLQGMKQVTNTFLRTDDGFKVTNPEGFVAVDRLKGNAVKLIDRLEFAHANFNATKNWSN